MYSHKDDLTQLLLSEVIEKLALLKFTCDLAFTADLLGAYQRPEADFKVEILLNDLADVLRPVSYSGLKHDGSPMKADWGRVVSS